MNRTPVGKFEMPRIMKHACECLLCPSLDHGNVDSECRDVWLLGIISIDTTYGTMCKTSIVAWSQHFVVGLQACDSDSLGLLFCLLYPQIWWVQLAWHSFQPFTEGYYSMGLENQRFSLGGRTIPISYATWNSRLSSSFSPNLRVSEGMLFGWISLALIQWQNLVIQ